mgnify:CR=1 FL=1
MKQIVKVEHMSCQNCQKHVTTHLQEMDGVTSVVVDLEAGTATVETAKEFGLSDYQAALEDTIYEAVAVN